MRIGLYGIPTAGKSFILEKIDFIEVKTGSRLLKDHFPDFDKYDETDREYARKEVALKMMSEESFIMDGHYAFGENVAFTQEEGEMYEIYLYLYISPEILKKRIAASEKNRKFSGVDIAKWQDMEIKELRKYCHEHNKDFYVLDNPPENYFDGKSDIILFIRGIVGGYSCVAYAKECADRILRQSKSDTIVLFDGDKTLVAEDTSKAVFGYETRLYDGNFYTGYQAWKHHKEFGQYAFEPLTGMPVPVNEKVRVAITADSYILTSGHEKIWEYISGQLGIRCFCGDRMSAETKLFITKFLQDAGKCVIAYGDGMNDYYMLKQADKGYLVTKPDGSVSGSLRGKNTEGLIIV